MTPTDRLNQIVEHGMCTSCGMCESLAGPEVVKMCTQPSGNLYPVAIGELSAETMDRIEAVCPGTALHGLPSDEIEAAPHYDTVWGAYHHMARAWAAEPAVRHHGSTGAVLTALGLYLTEACDEVDFVLHVRDPGEEAPTFGKSTVSINREDIMAAAGSRYGPTAALINFTQVLDRGQPFAFIGKPCDVSAIRSLATLDPCVDQLMKFCLSLVCGGYQPPSTFDAFIKREGLAEHGAIKSVKYRGNGCPGPTVVGFEDGTSASMTYTEFWGPDETTWGVPWRCKLCSDGIGDGADIAVADDWQGGGPNPNQAVQDADLGANSCVVRSRAGLRLWHAAIEAGYLTQEATLTPRYMDTVQPHQVKKKLFSKARYQGLAEMGRIAPQTTNLRLDECSNTISDYEYEHQRRGTIARVKAGKGDQPTAV